MTLLNLKFSFRFELSASTREIFNRSLNAFNLKYVISAYPNNCTMISWYVHTYVHNSWGFHSASDKCRNLNIMYFLHRKKKSEFATILDSSFTGRQIFLTLINLTEFFCCTKLLSGNKSILARYSEKINLFLFLFSLVRLHSTTLALLCIRNYIELVPTAKKMNIVLN